MGKLSDEYGHCGSQSALPTGCCLDGVALMAMLWKVLCAWLNGSEFLTFYCNG